MTDAEKCVKIHNYLNPDKPVVDEQDGWPVYVAGEGKGRGSTHWYHPVPRYFDSWDAMSVLLAEMRAAGWRYRIHGDADRLGAQFAKETRRAGKVADSYYGEATHKKNLPRAVFEAAVAAITCS